MAKSIRASIVPVAMLGIMGPLGIMNVQADEIRVTDCDGAPRAVRQVEQSTLSALNVRVATLNQKDLPSGAALRLVGSDGMDRRQNVSELGRAIFKDIPAGDWKLCASSDDLTVSQVTIDAKDSSATSTTTALLGGTGVAAAAVGLGIGLGGGSSGNSGSGDASTRTLSSANPNGQNEFVLPRQSANNDRSIQETANNTASRHPVCAASADCLSNATPAPISPIS